LHRCTRGSARMPLASSFHKGVRRPTAGCLPRWPRVRVRLLPMRVDTWLPVWMRARPRVRIGAWLPVGAWLSVRIRPWPPMHVRAWLAGAWLPVRVAWRSPSIGWTGSPGALLLVLLLLPVGVCTWAWLPVRRIAWLPMGMGACLPMWIARERLHGRGPTLSAGMAAGQLLHGC